MSTRLIASRRSEVVTQIKNETSVSKVEQFNSGTNSSKEDAEAYFWETLSEEIGEIRNYNSIRR